LLLKTSRPTSKDTTRRPNTPRKEDRIRTLHSALLTALTVVNATWFQGKNVAMVNLFSGLGAGMVEAMVWTAPTERLKVKRAALAA